MDTVVHTTIVHPVREELRLSITEYCVADTLHKLSCNRRNKHYGWMNLRKLMAMREWFDLTEYKMKRVITELVYKDVAELGEHGITLTRKWGEAHGYGGGQR